MKTNSKLEDFVVRFFDGTKTLTQKSLLMELQLMLSLTKYLMGCTMNIYITLVNVLKDVST